jgi:hypothetical protein
MASSYSKSRAGRNTARRTRRPEPVQAPPKHFEQLEGRTLLSATVISEDFSAGAANFAAVDGSWAASGGAYRVTAAGTAANSHLNTRALHRTAVDGDFTLEADASVAGTGSAWNDFAVVFGYRDAGNYYYFSSNEGNDAGTSGLFRVVNGVSTELADVAAPIAAGTTYAVRVERAGGQISAFRNGQRVATASDSTFLSGQVGFGTKGDLATFDNLVVTRPTPPAPAVISEDFSAGAANFAAVDGSWAASGGAYRVTAAGTAANSHLNTRALHRTAVDGDFTLEADASVAGTGSAWNDFAVVFGYRDAGNYYYFSSNEGNDAGTSGLFRVVNGVSTELADVAAPIAAGTTYAVRVERAGGQISAFRNGQRVATASDSTFLSGQVGFGTKGDLATFDNLVVYGSAATPAPQPTTPAAPSGLTAAAASANTINLTWADNSSNETGFRIERSSNGGSTWVSAGAVGAGVRSYAAGGLTASTQYQFRVRAYNGAGDSANSNVATATTQAAPTAGVKPNATNTGPTNTSILRASGSITVTQDGAVIENVNVTGTINVQANNVTIRNFRINANGAGHAINYAGGKRGLVVEDGEVSNFGEAAIGLNYTNYTARRLNVHHSQRDGFKAEGNVLIENNWVHYLGMLKGAHADGVQSSKGSGLTVRGNNFDLPWDIGVESTSAFMIKSDFGPIDNVLIENNWLNGGQYTIYVMAGSFGGQSYPAPTNVRILNNKFGRDFHYGLYYPGAATVRQGNVWEDTGAPANN